MKKSDKEYEEDQETRPNHIKDKEIWREDEKLDKDYKKDAEIRQDYEKTK